MAHQYDVFISHASEDIEEARWLKQAISRAGWKPFLAEEDLNVRIGSNEWSAKIDEVLDSSGVVVVLMSPMATKSEWVDYEWRSIHKDILSRYKGRTGLIIPCCLQGIGLDDLDRALRQYQCVDMREPSLRQQNTRKLLSLIEGFLKEPIDSPAERPLIRILCLEGGGSRALIPGRILLFLEQRLQAIHGPEARLADAFDLIAGTSSGGVLALFLAMPGMTAADVVTRFRENLPKVFKSAHILDKLRMAYDSSAIMDVLSPVCGEMMLSDLFPPAVVVTYDVLRKKPCLLGQYRAKAEAGCNLKVLDAAVASVSVPPLFAPHEVTFADGTPTLLIDGCLFARNPSGIAVEEAQNLFSPRPLMSDLCILSLGTGQLTHWGGDPKGWNRIEWVPHLIDITMDAMDDLVHMNLVRIFHGLGRAFQYLRIEPILSEHQMALRMDNTEPSALDELQRIGDHLASSRSAEIEQFLSLLVTGGRMGKT